MCLSLETLTSIIWTGWPILVKLIDLVNSVIIFLSQMTLLRLLTFLLGSQTVILTDLQWFSLHWEILVLLSQFPLTFHHIHIRMSHFTALLMTIFVLTGMIFVIIWEMLHERISSTSVLLMLLVTFVSRFRLEVMYTTHQKYQVKPKSSL